MNTVELDLLREQQRMEAQEAREESTEAATVAAINRYWREYLDTGRIKDLDLDEEEVTFLALQKTVSSHRLIVEDEARKVIEKAPATYLPDLYESINWD